jgi:hypothetical protein
LAYFSLSITELHTDDITGHSIGLPDPKPITASEVDLSESSLLWSIRLEMMSGRIRTLLEHLTSGFEICWAIIKKQKEGTPHQTCYCPGYISKSFCPVRPPSFFQCGGIISLLDDNGIKIDGVSYTKAQS